MLFKASSRVDIVGALLVVMMVILLLVPQPANAEQLNGEYTIGFNIMHADKKNASIAEGYWNQPATVFIKDGSIRVQTTINKHAWVTKFAISYNGSMSEVKTISVDEGANVRITEFQASNLTDLVESHVSVYIEEIDYEHSYTMYIQFKPETLTLVKAEEPQVSDASTQAAAPAPAQEVEPVDVAEEQQEGPASIPAQEAVSGAEEEATDTAGEASSDGGSDNEPSREASNEPSDVNHQEKDASAISVIEETAGANAIPTEETVEEGGNGSIIAIIIAIIIVLVAIISVIVYRVRRNKQ